MSSITNYLKQLMNEGGNGNFLIINLQKEAYLQFASENGSTQIYCEASNSNPNTGLILHSHQTKELTQLNWELESSDYHNNYNQQKVIQTDADLEQLETLIHKTAAIYGTTVADFIYELNLQ